jgi:hypothetical protein
VTFRTDTGHNIRHLLKCVWVCVFCSRQFTILPALQTVFHLQIQEKKDQSQLELAQKLCICQKCIKHVIHCGHHVALWLKSIFNLFFQTEFQILVIWLFCFLHQFVYSVLLFLDCALFNTFVCDKLCCTYIGIIFHLINLQEQIDTVTVEVVEIVGEEDWIEIKTEEDYIQLVGRVKGDQEVSVLWWEFVYRCVCVHVCCTVHCV